MLPLYGALQKVVPQLLRYRVVELSHEQITSEHPGESGLFQTMRAKFYWPFITNDLIHHLENCRIFVKVKGLRFNR